MFAKYVNENKIEVAPDVITVGKYRVINPKQDDYIEGGYLPVYGEEKEPAPKWYHYVVKYELQENHIRQYYVAEKDDCPDYAEEVNNRIRLQYSQSAVEAIILNGSDTEEHAKDLADLQSYRATVKADVKAEIAEWEQA